MYRENWNDDDHALQEISYCLIIIQGKPQNSEVNYLRCRENEKKIYRYLLLTLKWEISEAINTSSWPPSTFKDLGKINVLKASFFVSLDTAGNIHDFAAIEERIPLKLTYKSQVKIFT